MTAPYNEPAFPHAEQFSDGTLNAQFPGMTLRDYFAAKAMAALIAEPNWDQESESGLALVFALTNDLTACGADRYSAAAYRVADAMLTARSATGAPA